MLDRAAAPVQFLVHDAKKRKLRQHRQRQNFLGSPNDDGRLNRIASIDMISLVGMSVSMACFG